MTLHEYDTQEVFSEHEGETQEAFSEHEGETQGAFSKLEEETQETLSELEEETQEAFSEHEQEQQQRRVKRDLHRGRKILRDRPYPCCVSSPSTAISRPYCHHARGVEDPTPV